MPTNNLKIGNDDLKKIYLGNEQIAKMYLGNELVYDASETLTADPNIHNPGDITFDPIEELL